MYRSEVWKTIGGYDETIHGAEDYDFWIRAAAHYAIRRLPVDMPPLYAYRVHASSMSSTVKGCYTRMRLAVLSRELKQRPRDFWLYKAWLLHFWMLSRESMLAARRWG